MHCDATRARMLVTLNGLSRYLLMLAVAPELMSSLMSSLMAAAV